MERPETDNQYSRRLPPPEAWKKPDRYVDLSTGLALPYRSQLVLPVDDRGFVKIDAAIEEVKDHFFWNDYDWPYTPGDPETAPDEHHFYYDEADYSPATNGGSYVPLKFRTQPTHIGSMPRQFHNMLHDFTARPEKPEIEEMAQNVDAYKLALQALRKLYESAKETVAIERRFASRRQSLQNGTIKPHSSDDQIGQDFLRSAFAVHFRSYSDAVDIFRRTDAKELVHGSVASIEVARRKHVATHLGKFISRQHINCTPLIRGAA